MRRRKRHNTFHQVMKTGIKVYISIKIIIIIKIRDITREPGPTVLTVTSETDIAEEADGLGNKISETRDITIRVIKYRQLVETLLRTMDHIIRAVIVIETEIQPLDTVTTITDLNNAVTILTTMDTVVIEEVNQPVNRLTINLLQVIVTTKRVATVSPTTTMMVTTTPAPAIPAP